MKPGFSACAGPYGTFTKVRASPATMPEERLRKPQVARQGRRLRLLGLEMGRDYPLPEYIYPLSDDPPFPPGPRFEGSFSDRFTFATHEDMDRFKYLRIERARKF